MSFRLRKSKTNTTRKISGFSKLKKCPRARIAGMESFKINCGKNLILGYHTIKGAEETSTHSDEFVHVALARLKDYNKPVVIKVYDERNFHLPIEQNILKSIAGFRNTASLICDFSCQDDKNKYISKIQKQMRFCGNGKNKLHFFVYEYISHGDISDFTKKYTNYAAIKNIILQMTCVIIELATIYRIYHNDINSGNILIDTTDEKTLEYCIEGEIVRIESHGVIPKIIDYGRSNFYEENVPNTRIWFDIILMIGVVHRYVKNDMVEKKLLDITEKIDMQLPTLMDYYLYIHKLL